MRVACTALALAGVVSVWPARPGGWTFVTLSGVRETARERGPQIASVHLGLAEAQGRVGSLGRQP